MIFVRFGFDRFTGLPRITGIRSSHAALHKRDRERGADGERE